MTSGPPATTLLGQSAVAGLRTNPRRAITALVGYAAAIAVATAGWNAGSLGDGGWMAGALLLAVIAGATAATTDARQLRAAAVFGLSGAARWQRRATVVLEALLLAVAALPLGAAAGLAVTAVTDTRAPSLRDVAVLALAVPPIVALGAGRARVWVTVVDARGRVLPRGRRGDHAAGVFRLLLGIALVGAGVELAALSGSWFELDVLLWPAIALAGSGMALLLPMLVNAAAWLLDRTPWLAANLAAALLRSRRALLVPALLLGTVTAFAVAVQGVLGVGLVEREQRRQDYLDRFTFTAGLHPDAVVVGQPAAPAFELGLPHEQDGGGVRAAAERVRAAYPEATVTEITYLPSTSAGFDPLVPDPDWRRVAVATPGLLGALGLDRYTPDLRAGRAVALDPTIVHDNRAELRVYDPLDRPPPTVRRFVDVDVVTADLASIPLRLPALLLPPDHGVDVEPGPDTGPATPPYSLLVRFPHRTTESDARAVAAVAGGGVDAWPGGQTDRFPRENGQLDAANTVGLRRPDQVGVAVTLIGLIALVGMFVTLRLLAVTRRSDEDVVETLGGSPALLRRLAVVQAAVLGLLATSLGLTAGIALTAAGIARYNSDGRFADGVTLPPIPLAVPTALWIGLVTVPLLAAGLAWVLALRRPPPTPSTLADGLLW